MEAEVNGLSRQIEDAIHTLEIEISRRKLAKYRIQGDCVSKDQVTNLQQQIKENKTALLAVSAVLNKTEMDVNKLLIEDNTRTHELVRLESKEKKLIDVSRELERAVTVSRVDEKKLADLKRLARVNVAATGIKFDYSIKTEVVGYVAGHNCIEPFKCNLNSPNLTDQLWEKVARAGKIDWNARLKKISSEKE